LETGASGEQTRRLAACVAGFGERPRTASEVIYYTLQSAGISRSIPVAAFGFKWAFEVILRPKDISIVNVAKKMKYQQHFAAYMPADDRQ
jgi:hypothetical protein